MAHPDETGSKCPLSPGAHIRAKGLMGTRYRAQALLLNGETSRGAGYLRVSDSGNAVTVQTASGHEIDGLGGVMGEQGASAVMIRCGASTVRAHRRSKPIARFYKLGTDLASKLSKAEALRQAHFEMLRPASTPKNHSKFAYKSAGGRGGD
jgi:hypothetical protein